MAGVIFIRIFAGHGAGHVPGTSWRRLPAASTPSQASKTAPLLTSPRDSQARPGARGWLPLIRPGDPCPGSRPAFASIPGCGQLPPSPAPRAPQAQPTPRSGRRAEATSAAAGERGTFPRSGSGTSARCSRLTGWPRQEVSGSEWNGEEALERARDPESLAELGSASLVPA